jgi:flavin reductase (DIM6/NTAB) family NADH-FMN oxidoreductase RutF
MTKSMVKIDLPVSQIRRYLEPGPIVLVSSALDDTRNIMTMGWHIVMEFTPSLIGCVIASGNHSFDLIRKSGECVINLPTTTLTDTVVGIGKHARLGDRQVRAFWPHGATGRAREGAADCGVSSEPRMPPFR